MNVQQLQAKFKKLARDIQPTAMDYLGYANIAKEERQRGFVTGTGPNGEKWQRLKLATVLAKQKGGTTTKYKQNREGNKFVKGGSYQKVRAKGNTANATSPLRMTDDLMNATSKSDRNSGRVVLAGSRSQNVWNGKSISMIHDEGTGKIPKRHHWGIYKEARRRIERAYNIKFSRALREAFPGAVR